MKKLLVLIASVLALVLSLSACSSKESSKYKVKYEQVYHLAANAGKLLMVSKDGYIYENDGEGEKLDNKHKYYDYDYMLYVNYRVAIFLTTDSNVVIKYEDARYYNYVLKDVVE